MKEQSSKDVEVNEDVKELVVTRIEASRSDLRLSVGGGRSMTKEEMIDHVRKGDKIGKQIIRAHLNFLRAVASGELGSALASV